MPENFNEDKFPLLLHAIYLLHDIFHRVIADDIMWNVKNKIFLYLAGRLQCGDACGQVSESSLSRLPWPCAFIASTTGPWSSGVHLPWESESLRGRVFSTRSQTHRRHQTSLFMWIGELIIQPFFIFQLFSAHTTLP